MTLRDSCRVRTADRDRPPETTVRGADPTKPERMIMQNSFMGRATVGEKKTLTPTLSRSTGRGRDANGHAHASWATTTRNKALCTTVGDWRPLFTGKHETPTHSLKSAPFVRQFLAGAARAEDWPQWLGPQRDGVWRETGIVRRLSPAAENPLAVPSSGGYSSPPSPAARSLFTTAIRGEKLPTTQKSPSVFSTPGVERVSVSGRGNRKDAVGGEYPCDYTMSYPAGPRAAPIVGCNRVLHLWRRSRSPVPPN